MRALFILIFSIVVHQALSQSNQKDLIYQSQKDSIQVRLVIKNAKTNARFIEFQDESGGLQKKYAREIYGYKTSTGNLYISKRITSEASDEHLFCQIIVLGYAKLFTTYSSEGDVLKYIQIGEDELILLKDGIEVNTLTFLFKDCKDITQEKIAEANPVKIENLASLVMEYNNCMDPIGKKYIVSEFEGNKIKIDPVVFVGLGMVGMKNSVTGKKLDLTSSFLVGVRCDIRFSSSFSLTPGLYYLYHEVSTSGPFPMAPESMTLFEDYHLSRIQGELGLKLFLGNKSLTPYISATPVFSLFSDIRKERRVISSAGEYQLNDPVIEYYTLGVRGAFGLQYQLKVISPFIELRYSYEQLNPKSGASNTDEYSINSIQIVGGISF